MDKENEKINELTRKQMEKVSGGLQNPDVMIRQVGTDCFLCKATLKDSTDICSKPLKQIQGKLYRCVNPNCSMFGLDQYPNGK